MANATWTRCFCSRCWQTTKSPCDAERRWRRPGSLETDPIMSIKYDGASPCRHLCTSGNTSWTGSWWCTGSQWSSSRMFAVKMWSYFRIRRIRRAAEWRTDCSGIGDEPHRHDWGCCCSSRFDWELMRAPASLPHPSSADSEPTRAAEVGRSSFWTAVVCVRQIRLTIQHHTQAAYLSRHRNVGLRLVRSNRRHNFCHSWNNRKFAEPR